MKLTPLKSLLGLLFTALQFIASFKDDLLKEIDTMRNQLSEMQKRINELNKILNVLADSLSQIKFWQLYTAITSPGIGIGFQSYTNGNINGVFVQNQLITINAWTNVIGTYESGIWKLFINGVLIQSTSSTIAFNNGVNNPFTIGN